LKTRSLTTFAYFILILLATSCNKNTGETEEQPGVTIIVKNLSECLDLIKTTGSLQADSNQCCIIYNYNTENNRLNITHENAGFNCCPGEITCAISFSNDTITIEEIPEYAICNCECLFNLEIEVNGVLSKSYFLKFIEPYAGDQEKLEFIIDLQQQFSGEYCVERDQYPWGI